MSLAVIERIQKNQLKYGAILSYVQMTLGVVIGLLYTPYMIRMLGKNEYGLYSTVSSTISMLTILNLGLNAGYIRYFAKYKVDNDNDSIAKLNGLYLVIFSIIGVIALVCGLVMAFNLDFIFSEGLTPDEYVTARILAILTTINMAVSFPASTFSTIISAHEKFVVLKSLAMIRTALTPAIMLPILYSGYKSIAMVAVTVILSFIVDISYYVYCRKILKIKFRFDGLDKTLLKSLFAYTFFIALNSIIDQLNWNTDKCVLARFNGTAAVAVYSVAYSLIMFFMNISISISSVFTPRIHTFINESKNDSDKLQKDLTDLFVKIGRLQFLLIALVVSGFWLFGRQFIFYWVGVEYEDSYYIMLVFMFSLFIPLIQNLGIEIQRALNRHQFRSIVYIITAIGHLVLSIMICPKYGAIGCAIGNAISLLIGSGVVINVFYHKCCYINIFTFWKVVFKMAIGLIPPVAFMLLAKEYSNFDTIPVYVSGIFAYTVIYCISMWLFAMNDYEKSLIPFFRKFQNREKTKC